MNSSSASVLSRIRGLLGRTGDEADPVPGVSLETLLRRTRRQIIELVRGVEGIRRLTENALAARLLRAREAFEAMTGSSEAERADPHELGEIEHIPWGYGQDRVTIMVVDPERLYVYWEVTDDALERTRPELGPGGPDASLNLRVYDVSNRIFDGTNAHSYFDQAISRSDRQWFFFIGKPTSAVVVELGLKSHEGYFVRIARSGRVEFPRREPVSPGEVEWLTVRPATGEIDAPSAPAPPATIATATGFTAHVEPVRVWDIRRTHGVDPIVRDESFGPGWRVFEWAGEHRIEWEGPLIRTAWEAGPFPYPLEPEPYVEERHGGTVTVRSEHGRTRVVYGPWQVVIRGLGARAGRRVLAVWEMRRSWIADAGGAVQAAAPGVGPRGASEQVVLGASELRLGGASELYRLGASELRYLGASEQFYAAASEWRLGGASERRFPGASEWISAGASERRYAGASERWPRKVRR